MARPRKEGMDYFPHDVHMSTDKKVKALRIMYGNDGYTFFNIALEMIYQEPNFELDVSDAETIQILASNVEVTTQKLSEMIATAVKHGCFDKERYTNDGVLTSNGILKRADVVTKKRVAMRDKYDKKVSDEETPPETPQRKGKESKSKDKVKEVIKDSPQFSEFWNMYPRRVGNADALTAWNNAIKRGAEPSDIYKAVENYRINIQQSGTETNFIKHPSSFLNKDRWKDYLKLTVLNGGGNGGKHGRGFTGNAGTYDPNEDELNDLYYGSPKPGA
jgi:hypothetical protein